MKTPNMSIRKIKEKILFALPSPVARYLYLIRNYPKLYEANVLNELSIALEINNRDKVWQQRLSQKNGHEIGICTWLSDHVSENDIFYDIGSCYGFFSALVTQLKPAVQVHAFEASPFLYYFLQRNSRRNQAKTPWVTVNKYLGDKDSKKMMRLDTYLKSQDHLPTIVKMDVDGAEYMILKGGSQLIQNRKTEFLIEVHPHMLPGFDASVEMVLDLFDKDFKIKVLPQIRKDNQVWSDDLSLVQRDDNPYIYVAPAEIARF